MHKQAESMSCMRTAALTAAQPATQSKFLSLTLMKRLLGLILAATLLFALPLRSVSSPLHPIQQEKQEKKETKVCITKTGKKYHTCNCSYLRQSSYSITKKEAIRLGYTACSRCQP